MISVKTVSQFEQSDLDSFRPLVGFCSIQGTRRDNNEDSYYIDPDRRFFIVADGMGGCQAGEVASRIAVGFLRHSLEQLFENDPDAGTICKWLPSAFDEANDLILYQKGSDLRLSTMGTTIVVAVVIDRTLFVSGLGDSRAYLVRNAEATQLTEDHTVTQGLVAAGILSAEQAKQHAFRNVLWKFLGCEECGNEAKVTRVELRDGDAFLLASDGLTDKLKNSEIAHIIAEHPDPQQSVDRLVQRALENGTVDDVTCVMVSSGGIADSRLTAMTDTL